MREFGPFHPGDILREEFMDPYGLSEGDLAGALAMPVAGLTAFLAGEQPVSAELALRLGRYFGTTPRFWMNLQSQFDLGSAVDTVSAKVEREVTPREPAPAPA